jgi:hypothetical protein
VSVPQTQQQYYAASSNTPNYGTNQPQPFHSIFPSVQQPNFPSVVSSVFDSNSSIPKVPITYERSSSERTNVGISPNEPRPTL